MHYLFKKTENVGTCSPVTIKSSTKSTFNWKACWGFHSLIVWLPSLKEGEEKQNGELMKGL